LGVNPRPEANGKPAGNHEQHLPVSQGTGFSPEVARIMGETFDRARRDLHDGGQPAVVREIFAKRIIDLVAWGESDSEIIASKALDSVGIKLV
jgi:hypothetical protein